MIFDPVMWALAKKNASTSGSGGNTDFEDAVVTRKLSGAYTNNRVDNVGNYAFGYTEVSSVSFPAAKSVGYGSFYFCEKLKTANFPLVETVGDRAFSDCSLLEELNLPMVTDTGTYAFGFCTSLKEIKFQKSVYLDEYAFVNCESLKKVDFAKVSVTKNFAFAGCCALDTIIVRDTEAVFELNTFAFRDTPILEGRGFFYMPSSMYETYRAVYEAALEDSMGPGAFDMIMRKIEDYPEICG